MPSPTFPISSCLTNTSTRTLRFDIDISTNSPLSSCASTSSTLSESSNSTPLFFVSTKRNRAPRKRPNQCSAEAAALLSSIYPKLFSSANLHRSSFPVLLPSFPSESLLLQTLPSPANSSVHPKLINLQYSMIPSSADFGFQDPGSPDFDAESILDEEVGEGIDSIMGNLSMSKESSPFFFSSSDSIANPWLASLMGFGRWGISSNIKGALRKSNDGEWWRSPKVAVKSIVEKAVMEENNSNKKKKKKKKKKVEEANERKVIPMVSLQQDGSLKTKLGLKLNYDGVLKDWIGGYPFSGDTSSPESAAGIIISLADASEPFLDMREASVQRYKEKRRNRLFSKKIRYEVRKTNAIQRPRMKGRFVRGPLLREAVAEGS